MTRDRLLSVDALRGFAMVLVIFQHAYLNVDRRSIAGLLDRLIWPITGLAAVAFVSIAGAMLTYSLLSHSDWRRTRWKNATRAAFLILVAHPAINLASYYFRMTRHNGSSNFDSILGRIFLDFPITDVIAVCLLVTPGFIVHTGIKLRSAAIVTILAVTPFIVAFMNPANPGLVIFKEAVFGVAGEPSLFWFPLAPWIAIFLIGSFAGQALTLLKQGALDISVLVRGLRRVGSLLIVCGVMATLGYKVLRMAYAGDWRPDLFGALYPKQTTTLLPGYIGLLAWSLAGFMSRIDIHRNYDRCARLLSILGRTSLFTYIIQFAVIESVPALLGMTGSLRFAGFLALFAVGLVVVWLLAYGYGRMRGLFHADDFAAGLTGARNHGRSPGAS